MLKLIHKLCPQCIIEESFAIFCSTYPNKRYCSPKHKAKFNHSDAYYKELTQTQQEKDQKQMNWLADLSKNCKIETKNIFHEEITQPQEQVISETTKEIHNIVWSNQNQCYSSRGQEE